MNDIHENGFVLLKNVLTPNDLQFGLSSINDDNKVDYTIVDEFVRNIFLEKIKRNVDFMSDPIYVKFRLSNNNNSTDASTFHGDIYNNTGTKLLPIYTCLCYFDNAQLEVIPGSHKYNNNGKSMESYNKKQVINIESGNILIFHSNLHHRGIGYNKTKNRRLLQVFEVFPDKKTYHECADKLILIQTSDSVLIKRIVGPLMYHMAQYPKVINFVDVIHYQLMYNDMHYKVALMDISPSEKKNNYVSYESGKRILLRDTSDKEDLNVNIIYDQNIKTISYSNYYLYYFLLYFIIGIILIYLIPKLWKEYSPKKPTRRLRSSFKK
jgi:hypothetical protein